MVRKKKKKKEESGAGRSSRIAARPLLLIRCRTVIALPLLFAGTIFCYGQTASGKTHTMTVRKQRTEMDGVEEEKEECARSLRIARLLLLLLLLLWSFNC